ncbi:hypothetical protein ACMX2H_15860 [Arthrobacter sulfonylureivorans]|uniref:hypothetical protein n=1 Tax=Arthrobacter sulfonylureivorans TaxID=2486855 RepID=UPI0039E6CBDB
MTIQSIQLASSANGSRPYPHRVDDTSGKVLDQDFWKGEPAALVGFQNSADVQHVDLHTRDWAAQPEKAVGMYPVFVTARGGLYCLTLPVASVTAIASAEDGL